MCTRALCGILYILLCVFGRLHLTRSDIAPFSSSSSWGREGLESGVPIGWAAGSVGACMLVYLDTRTMESLA